jgi:lipopolysaccharide transport system ATP-binding protein
MSYAVRFEGVWKEYQIYQHLKAGFKSFLFNLPRNISSFKGNRFIALKNLSFEVKKGETFGIIGRNGSGKSTVLGLTAGVIRPDKGAVGTDGRISSLLELGAGFHPDLSGFENIILNGILMGNTKNDILKKARKIIEFSELGEFIGQPLRTYSSGMQMRLGFSVAIHIDPEILLIDEALSVGDLSFQAKCKERMNDFRKSGATIIIVSHDMESLYELSDRVAWLDEGEMKDIGAPEKVIRRYLKHIGQLKDEPPEEESEEHSAGVPTSSEQLRLLPETEVRGIGGDNPPGDVPSLSWWDSPLVIRLCEARVTGDSHTGFYEYLKKEFGITGLERGVIISRRLEGIGKNFVKYKTCKFIDVLDGRKGLPELPAGEEDGKGRYDLAVCIDFLSAVEEADGYVERVSELLKDGGFLIALEYVGPGSFTGKESAAKIADVIYRDVNGGGGERPQVLSRNRGLLPSLNRCFDIISLRDFAGPFHDLIIEKILRRFGAPGEREEVLVEAIAGCEQVLVENRIIPSMYSLIIGRKRGCTGNLR